MKIPVPVRKHTASTFSALAITTLLLAVLNLPANAGTAGMPHSPDDTILVQKQLISKKYKIRLYPNASHEVLFFSASNPAKEADGKVYQLFLFDVEGNLIKQANIRNKQTTVLNNIEKGSYLFEIFSDDERIESGQVIVR